MIKNKLTIKAYCEKVNVLNMQTAFITNQFQMQIKTSFGKVMK